MVAAIGVKENKALEDLKNRHLRQVTVVFAIYDHMPSHRVPTAAVQTSEILKGTLSTFARAELLTRTTELRAMGYEVAACRIRPYPKPKGAQ